MATATVVHVPSPGAQRPQRLQAAGAQLLALWVPGSRRLSLCRRRSAAPPLQITVPLPLVAVAAAPASGSGASRRGGV